MLDGEGVSVEWGGSGSDVHREAFLHAVALGRQPQSSLFALYQGWIDTLMAPRAARRTGSFVTSASADAARVRREALRECERLEAVIVRLRATVAKEKQMPRQVELNLELKRVEAARATALAKL